jgi:class 3 adenylate cyclase
MAAISSPTQKAYSLWERWSALPHNATSAERRYYTFLTIIGPASWLLHFLHIFLFAYWSVWTLAIVNVFSVLLWTAIIILWRQRQLSLAMVLAVFEVIVHSTLVVVFLGWGFGSQYFFIVLAVGIVLLSWWPHRLNVILVALCSLLFILLYYYTELYPPIAFPPAVQIAIINATNIAVTFGVIAASTIYLIAEIEHADKLNEDLLNNVLPKPIVTRLKLKNPTGNIANPKKIRSEGIAESFSDVSVLFADVVGFTPLSERLTPQETVDLLDEVFTNFDALADKYGVEKIRTIGDGYMVAAGAPVPLANHAQALVSMALEMQSYMAQRELQTGMALQVRIGINSGSAVGGIVGTTRFHYDLWSDMVNTASRMESHGVPGKIQIARPTYELIKNDFHCEPRGMLEVKGKGEMEAWFVTRARSGLSEKVL